MDQAIVSTFSALAGTIVGGVTSVTTSFMTTNAQARAARLAAEHIKREDLYGRFMDELAMLYAIGLSSTTVDYAKMTPIYALRGRITLMSTTPVVESADRALKFVIDLALAPPRAPEEMRQMMDDDRNDAIADFARACRLELAHLKVA